MYQTPLHRFASTAGLAALLMLAACGSESGSSSQVASLGTLAADAASTETTVAVDSQEAILAYAACMRENGVDMADPTFDADGNAVLTNFGPDSGIDPQSSEFQTAQTACGDLIQGVEFGRGPGGGFDRDAITAALNDFTACLRDEGLDVDDITFGQPGDGGPNAAGPGADGGRPDGSVPAGGFNGGPQGAPPAGSATGPGGDGFDPTQMMIDRLGLDDSDPAVTAALAVCQPIMDDALTTTTTAG
jgi:hypothetical protein